MAIKVFCAQLHAYLNLWHSKYDSIVVALYSYKCCAACVPQPMLCMFMQADLSQPRGVGEKRLLREVATSLGCHTAAALPKRAIQFGSRMAKLAGSSNSREHGKDTCDRLLFSSK